jgi:dienelactone hydrolase
MNHRRRGRVGIVLAAALAAGSLVAVSGPSSATATAGHVRGRAVPSRTAIPAWHTPSRSGSGVLVESVTIDVPHQPSVDAYVVRPAGRLRAHASAGILFAHWLGDIHNDRSEYLAEATELASRGVVSVLPQGYFPWVPNPDGTPGDVSLVRDQVVALRAALDHLAGLRAVDGSRIALVGHDYGAMYGALVADRDRRVRSLVLEAPDSTWGNWFATYWLGLEGADRTAYLALFAGLDPVDHTARLGRHVLFQWAGRDNFVTPEVRGAFAATSPKAKVLFYERSDHQLTDAAQLDRDAFLADELHLPAP